MSHPQTFYLTTPIYYVNDRPHVGHCYTSVLADVLARFQRMLGRDVFFLTGTDEHGQKVEKSAAERGISPQALADQNARHFVDALTSLGVSNDDFIRTTEPRHTAQVQAALRALLESGDVYLGTFEGWYDEGQEEYITDNQARERDYKGFNGRPLVKAKEENFYFRLTAYADRVRALIEDDATNFVAPEARRNEVLGRLREEARDVPVSRTNFSWGVPVPGHEEHVTYVWIDALLNYATAVGAIDPAVVTGRAKYWPADVHLLGKEILWFHAVIWPALLMALEKALGRELKLPKLVYAHSFWVRDGRKMSKTLGNFIDLPTIDAYVDRFGLDAFRWFFATQGPLDATDADFSYDKFVDVYNADLANGIGNAASRVTNMIEKYFAGLCPTPGPQTEVARGDAGYDLRKVAPNYTRIARRHVSEMKLGAAATAAREIVKRVDAYINETKPFTLAKQPARMEEVGTILYECAEALRIAAILLAPYMPTKMGDLLESLAQTRPNADGSFDSPFDDLTAWGGLKPGTRIVKGQGLFPRADADLPEPAPPSP